MQLRKGQEVLLDIYNLAFHGAGVGKFEGLTVFVEGTMPGDKVRASLTRIKPNFAEAKLIEIVTPSPSRIAPKCPNFDKCGGCQMQFIPYEKQLEIKKQYVIDAFERIGKIYNPPVNDVIPCEDHFYYRNKLEFSFGYDADMKFALGFHVPGRRFDIMNINECYLESEFSSKIVNLVRDITLKYKWIPFSYSNGTGFLKELVIREGKSTNEVLINFITSDDAPKDLEEGLKELVDELNKLDGGGKKIVSIYWSKVISRRGAPRQIKDRLLYGKHYLTEKLILKNEDELLFDIFPRAFFQVNTKQAEILYSQVIDFALLKPLNFVFDLFCGTGTIGLFIAKHVKQVYGIELNEDAVKSAMENARKNKIFNIDFYIGDVSKLLKNIKEYPSLIIVDPPRIGLTEKMINQINDFSASDIIYVSCNPSTLARDCALLKEYGYQIKNIQPVDMFPHTYHIENVCLLQR